MSVAVEAGLPLPETRDTEPPLCGSSPADLREDPFQLPSPRASHSRALDAALPDLTLATVLRLLGHVAKPGNSLDCSNHKGGAIAAFFSVTLYTSIDGVLRSFTGTGTPEAAAKRAFEELDQALAESGPVDTYDPEAASDSDEAALDRCFE